MTLDYLAFLLLCFFDRMSSYFIDYTAESLKFILFILLFCVIISSCGVDSALLRFEEFF